MLKKIVVVLGVSGLLLSVGNAMADSITPENTSVSPQSLDLSPLRNLNVVDNPMDKDYSYHEAFKKIRR